MLPPNDSFARMRRISLPDGRGNSLQRGKISIPHSPLSFDRRVKIGDIVTCRQQPAVRIMALHGEGEREGAEHEMRASRLSQQAWWPPFLSFF